MQNASKSEDAMQHWFEFKDGKFMEGGLPPGFDIEAEDWVQELNRCGFSSSQGVGDDNGLHYELLEGSEGWVVLFATADLCFYIRVKSLPDLIELLSKLSVIALAAAL